MKKETVNTFTEGLVKDLNPLTTPNNVLTDALNATLVTYNGNEKVLQNDMGNTEVGTAFLPAGYVPVGMKEHGGIIYVAAWNPSTNKGQVGSFPSPRLLWEGEDWNINIPPGTTLVPVSFSSSDFYDGKFIANEIVKKNLFKWGDGTQREFHPGDKYAITVPKPVYDSLQSYVNDGKIKLQLGVVKKDGGIEIMCDAADDFFLFPVEGEENDLEEVNYDLDGGATAKITANKPRVFNATSSGNLMIIITINTLDSFDLLRTYSLVQTTEDGVTTENVRITFKGNGKVGNTIHTSDESPAFLRLATGNANTDQTSIVLEGNTGQLDFTIYPQVNWGIVKRMKRSGRIDFDKIKKSQGDFHEWRFFVTPSYIKIGWAYEFYNLDGTKEISSIKMKFFDYVKPSSYPNSPVDMVEFTKDVYSGNFEDFIYRDAHPNIMDKHIYIVQIIRCLSNGTEETITHKMLYVSQLYNSLYNSIYDDNLDISFQSIVEFTNPRSQSASVKFTPKLNYEQDGCTLAYVSNPVVTDHSVGDITNLSQSYYITPTSQLSGDTSELRHEYKTRLVNNYKGDVEIEASLDYKHDDIIGVPKSNLLSDALGSIALSATLSGDLEWSGDGNLYTSVENSVSLDTEHVTSSITDNVKTFSNITIQEDRYIQGLSSGVKNTPYEVVEQAPVYNPKASTENKRRVLGCFDYNEPKVISGTRDESFCYNSTLSGTSVIEGTSGGGGEDDTGLDTAAKLMNDTYVPTVNMMAAVGGQDASLLYLNKVHRVNRGGWSCGKNEVDGSDNFLVAVWKFTDGMSRFVNLWSARTWKANSAEAWPRLDVMLRCFLSQIFVAQRTTKKEEYITTNGDYYRYLKGNKKLKVQLNKATEASDVITNIMCAYEGADTGLASTPLTDILLTWNTLTGTTITNLIPVVNAHVDYGVLDQEVEIEGDFSINAILKFYIGLNYSVEDRLTIDPKKIWIIDNSSANVEYNKSVCGDGTALKPGTDGAFVWNGLPILKEAKAIGTPGSAGDTETILDWKGGTWKLYTSLYRMFTTRGAYENWTTVDEGAYNELLGNLLEAEKANYTPYNASSIFPGLNLNSQWRAVGEWVEGKNHNAPDLFFNVLSSDKSIYEITHG